MGHRRAWTAVPAPTRVRGSGMSPPPAEPGQPAAMGDIVQEVVVRLSYPVRFTHGILDPRNATLRDAVDAPSRVLVVLDDGLLAAQPAIACDALAYCRAHADRLELVAAAARRARR